MTIGVVDGQGEAEVAAPTGSLLGKLGNFKTMVQKKGKNGGA
jgi:hypothetical protein